MHVVSPTNPSKHLEIGLLTKQFAKFSLITHLVALYAVLPVAFVIAFGF